MSTQVSLIALSLRLAVAFSAFLLPNSPHAAGTSLIESVLTGDFSSIQLNELRPTTTERSEKSRLAGPAVVGPVEAVDLVSNQIFVAGQKVDMTGADIDSYSVGDYVAIAGVVTPTGISQTKITPLPIAYIYGASLSYIEGYVAKSNTATATAKIGDATVDFSAVLSKSPNASTRAMNGAYVRVVGIQSLPGLITSADLDVVDLSLRNDFAIRSSTKSIIGGDRSAKAIIGGDRSAKAIIGSDRSAKTIIGGDRSAKALNGGDSSGNRQPQ